MVHLSAITFCICASVAVGVGDDPEVGAELVLGVDACVGVGDDVSEARAEKREPRRCGSR